MTLAATRIAEQLRYSQHLGFRLDRIELDRAVVTLPYAEHLGIERVNGGAISSLVDTTATCAFWSDPDIPADSFGATVGFSINFLRLVVACDLTATARVRRRGGNICVGEVSVRDPDDNEIAFATVTYTLKKPR